MIAITSPMYLAQKSLSTSSLAKDQMIAGFLAQDGIEAVKNIRDQIAIRGDSSGNWLGDHKTGLLYPCFCTDSPTCNLNAPSTARYCLIDSTATSWDSNSIIKDLSLNYNTPIKMFYQTVNGVKTFLKYGYLGTDGVDSKFIRYINIWQNPTGSNNNEALVNVRVTWNSPSGPQNINLQDYIYNYSENF